jgi:Prp8 binding protein
MGGAKRAADSDASPLGNDDLNVANSSVALAQSNCPDDHEKPFPRNSEIVPVDAKVVSKSNKGGNDRTSNLLAPTMLLSGHSAAIFSMAFSPLGKTAASASFDRTIFLWNIYGECTNYRVLTGHKNAVLQVQWSYDGGMLMSASADKTLGIWDAETGRRMKSYKGHQAIVNSVCPVTKGPLLLVSGGDDKCVKVIIACTLYFLLCLLLIATHP